MKKTSCQTQHTGPTSAKRVVTWSKDYTTAEEVIRNEAIADCGQTMGTCPAGQDGYIPGPDLLAPSITREVGTQRPVSDRAGPTDVTFSPDSLSGLPRHRTST